MACFVAPLTEALIITVAKGIINKSCAKKVTEDASANLKLESFNKKISILEKMLYGGSGLLAIEHIYHGEIIFYPPFLTAVKNGEVSEMLREIATAGVSMALIVTGVWAIGLLVKHLLSKKNSKLIKQEK